jgi:divalent metal cation (Fe/Co/Zn/Cd) transporter
VVRASTSLEFAEHHLLVHRVKVLSWLALGWLAVDAALGMTAGVTANSVALVGWGLDCTIQAVAAIVLLWRFTGARIHSDTAERRAQKMVAVSFFALAAYIIVTAVTQLVTGDGAAASWLGITLAATDAALMPFLGGAKTRVGHRLGSYATTSEGRQNILCAYLSLAVLVGLAANAFFGWWWADPVVAVLVAVAVIQAGVRTWRGERC